jgi:methionine-S-sulfoxide reductase
VFEGEQMTDKNVRHCVNSISMEFVTKDQRDFMEKIYLGGGCFWCTEATFQRLKGVKSVLPGYAGGDKEKPTYDEVSAGHTGHAEVIEVEYDASLASLEILLSVFFAVHDPTTLNRQGADVGTQYRSIILYTNDVQKEVALDFIKKLEIEGIFNKPIVTEVKSLTKFYPAEDYHKNYFKDHPEAAYCQLVIAPKIDKLVAKFQDLLVN